MRGEGAKRPSRGVEFASRQARTEGCNPCELAARIAAHRSRVRAVSGTHAHQFS
jgi:hypothetical protein